MTELHPHNAWRGVLSNITLGFSDGMIVTLAFLTGVALNTSNTAFIVIAGIAAIAADTISMFFSVFLSVRTERDLYEADYKRELYEIENEPEEETEEMVTFYINKGLSRGDAEAVVSKITKDKTKWLEDMLLNELHLHKDSIGTPTKSAAINGMACLAGGLIPFVPYLLTADLRIATIISIVISFSSLLVVGGMKGRNAHRSPLLSGGEMLVIGAVATLLVYLVGKLLIFV